MTEDLERPPVEEIGNIGRPKGIACPKCGSEEVRHAEETSDHPGAFRCKDCDHGFLA